MRKQQRPTTGYAPVNGLKMYYEVRGSGDPVVLLHGSFMTISTNWTEWIGDLSKTLKCRAMAARPTSNAISAMKTSPTTWLRFDPFALATALPIACSLG